MSKLKTEVIITMELRDGETQEQANDRLYDLLYESLCQNPEHCCDFCIESSEEEDQ